MTVSSRPAAALRNCATVELPSARLSTIMFGSVVSISQPGTEPSLGSCAKSGLRTILLVELQAAWRWAGVAGSPRARKTGPPDASDEGVGTSGAGIGAAEDGVGASEATDGPAAEAGPTSVVASPAAGAVTV